MDIKEVGGINRIRIKRLWSRRLMAGLVLTVGIGVPGVSLALERLPFSDPLKDVVLEQQRGGFRIGNLEISIGLEQVVAINGDIQIINRLLIPNLNQPIQEGLVEQRVEVAEANATQITTPAPSLQSEKPSAPVTPTPSTGGPAITVAPQPVVVAATELRNGGWITQIQNSVDQTMIQNIRSLNIKLNNVGLPSVNLPEVSGSHLLQSPSR